MTFTISGNNAWLFQKQYYKGFDWNKFKDESYAPNFFKSRLEKIRAVKLNQLRAPLQNLSILNFVTSYPGLVTGIGVNHETGALGELKLGFEFDYSTGMPVIKGHSIKGKLRSAFPQNQRNNVILKKEKAYWIHCIINEEETTEEGFDSFKNDTHAYQRIVIIEEEIFEGKVLGKPVSNYQQDIFFDAQISKASSHPQTNLQYLDSDFITPHGDKPLLNPTPLPFLKILPGVTFEFRFKLNENKILDKRLLSVDQKLLLFTKLLLLYGIGAKTNVGYGQFRAI